MTLERLKAKAQELSDEIGEEISPTRLATLLLVDSLDHLMADEFELAKEPTEIKQVAIQRKE